MACLLTCWGSALAQDVRLVGTVGGQRAIVVVDQSAPKTLAVGASHLGVTLLEVRQNSAIFDVQGERLPLTVGQAPTRVTPRGTAMAMTLQAGQGGHFTADGTINGAAVQFLVDTGASVVTMDTGTASRLGIPLGQDRIGVRTANGQTSGWKVQLRQVRIGQIERGGVEAVVIPEPMGFVLLGNSFLQHVRLTREAGTMVIQPR
ncbi:aspartyl protease family protein [Corticibacter populi]|nr:aspartyl protease family protein [Corticibacter populi]